MDFDYYWWRKVLASFSGAAEILYAQFCKSLAEMTEEDRLLVDDAMSRVPHEGTTFEHAAAQLLDLAFVRVESDERHSERKEWGWRRYQQREKKLGVRGKRHLTEKLYGHNNPRPPLHEQARKASSMLLGKTVKGVTRSRRGELTLEFTDGSRLSVGATAVGLDLAIQTDVESWAEGDPRFQDVM